MVTRLRLLLIGTMVIGLTACVALPVASLASPPVEEVSPAPSRKPRTPPAVPEAPPNRPGVQNSAGGWDLDGALSEPPPQPSSLENQDNTPIVLIGYKNAQLRFTLRSEGREYPMVLEPNRTFSLGSTRSWTIKFKRGAEFVEYRLRPAVYRFLPARSGFDLHHVVDLTITETP